MARLSVSQVQDIPGPSTKRYVAAGRNRDINSLGGRTKYEVFELYRKKLKQMTDLEIDPDDPQFLEELGMHFKMLTTRYAQDVNLEGTDILAHKKLLEQVRANPDSIAFKVRSLEAFLPILNDYDSIHEASNKRKSLAAATSFGSFGSFNNVTHLQLQPPSSFSPSIQPQILVSGEENSPDLATDYERLIFFEVTASAKDQPELLSRLCRAMSGAGLNIREAHAFNTHDGFSLDFFIVDGCDLEEEDELKHLLENRFSEMMNGGSMTLSTLLGNLGEHQVSPHMAKDLKSLYSEDWEIDPERLQVGREIGSGTFGKLYLGNYLGQKVAIKIIKNIMDNNEQQQDFIKEVMIMRKVRHKNIVQFIGSCTSPPNICILSEYMEGGSVQDYLRERGPLCLYEILKIGLDVASGMNYLHQMNIMHRDLKSANILMDENKTVKICDFGVAKILETNNCATAETGTYRWMAPEVIEHRPYDLKVDIYSFGILLWELMTGQIPYRGLTPLQAAVAVVQKGLRPVIPEGCPSPLTQLMTLCWDRNPQKRPSFCDIIPSLVIMLDRVGAEESRGSQSSVTPPQPTPSPKKLLSRFRR